MNAVKPRKAVNLGVNVGGKAVGDNRERCKGLGSEVGERNRCGDGI